MFSCAFLAFIRVLLGVNNRRPFSFFEHFAPPRSNFQHIGLSNEYARYPFALNLSSLKVLFWLQHLFPSENLRFRMRSLGIRVGLEGYLFCWRILILPSGEASIHVDLAHQRRGVIIVARSSEAGVQTIAGIHAFVLL
jgi:hypothetical protein